MMIRNETAFPRGTAMSYLTESPFSKSPLDHSRVTNPPKVCEVAEPPPLTDPSPVQLPDLSSTPPAKIKARPPVAELLPRVVAKFLLLVLVAALMASLFLHTRFHETSAGVLPVVVLGGALLFLGVLVVLIAIQHRRIRSLKRRELCIECAYPRRFLRDEASCPECGAACWRAYHKQ